MKNLKIVYSHHSLECGCSTLDIDLEDMTAAELKQILKAAQAMDDPDMKVSAGPEALSKLNFADIGKGSYGAKIDLEFIKRKLGVKPDETLIAAIDAPKMFSSKAQGMHLFADARLFFIYNKKTGDVRSTVFDPYTDAGTSDKELGEDSVKAKKEAIALGVSMLRSAGAAQDMVDEYARMGIQAVPVTEYDEEGNGQVLIDMIIEDEEAILALEENYDLENDVE